MILNVQLDKMTGTFNMTFDAFKILVYIQF